MNMIDIITLRINIYELIKKIMVPRFCCIIEFFEFYNQQYIIVQLGTNLGLCNKEHKLNNIKYVWISNNGFESYRYQITSQGAEFANSPTTG